MKRVVVVVDGTGVQTWTADEQSAAELRIRLLEAAEAGSTIRVELLEAAGDRLESVGTAVLRFGQATTVQVSVLADDRTGAVMGISR